MNIILFHPAEVQLPLPRSDPRSHHLLTVLRRQPGDTFDCGLIDGPRGKGTLVALGNEELSLTFVWGDPPPPLNPLHLIVGTPRPQTARDILREATSLGVAGMHFVRTERGEAAYAGSTLWKTNGWKSCVIKGAAQAFCTRLPAVTHGEALRELVLALPQDAVRLALDNYEASAALGAFPLSGRQPVVLALGAERGWSAAERECLRAAHFTLVHLGARVLRTETACIAALTLVKARCGWL